MNLSPVTDTVPASTYTFSAPADDVEIDLLDGLKIGSLQTTEIDSPTDDFALVHYANKTSVTINSGNPAQTILLNNSKAATGQTSLTINTGASPDQVDLAATPPGVAITVFTFAGDDSASVAGAGIPEGTTSTINAGVGSNKLLYDAGSAVVTITPGPQGGQYTIARAGSGSLVFQDFQQVTIASAIAAPPVAGAPVTFTAVEGLNLEDVEVATFTSGGNGTRAADFGATIDWGDGTSSAGVIVQDAGSPTVFHVQGSHLYTKDGTLTTSTTLRTFGGVTNTFLSTVPVTISFGASAPVTANGTATVGDAPIVLQGVPVAGTQSVLLSSALVGTFQTIDLNATAADFTASVAWGDGTTGSGAVTMTGAGPSGVTFLVHGTHNYAGAGTYPVTVTVMSAGGSTATAGTTAFISGNVPNVLTGRLDPASDSGISDSDGITFVRQPTYFGTADGLSRVTLSAQNVLGGLAVSLGGTTADPNGFWQIKSGAALMDGQYTVTATAVDQSGVTTATSQLGTITIDTVGPRVTELRFAQSPGRLVVQFQDDRSGLAPASLTDGRNYLVKKLRLLPGRLLVGNLSVTPPTLPTAPQTVTAPLIRNGNKNLRSGTFIVSVFSSALGITDVAGNPLDGEFYGRFPSGNGVPGGNFVAIVDTLHTRLLAIRPSQQGKALRGNQEAILNVALHHTHAHLASGPRKQRHEAQRLPRR